MHSANYMKDSCNALSSVIGESNLDREGTDIVQAGTVFLNSYSCRGTSVQSYDDICYGAFVSPSASAELKNGEINHYEITPDDFNIPMQSIEKLAVNDVAESLAMMQSVLDNTNGAAKDIVSLNAGAAIYAAGLADSIQKGVAIAIKTIASGAAKQKLDQLIEHSQSFKK